MPGRAPAGHGDGIGHPKDTAAGEASRPRPRTIHMQVVVLGIDPGPANTGYGVVLAHGSKLAALDGGVIATEPSEPLERRLARIHTRVLDLITEHAPVALAIEDLYFGQNARSAFQVGQARGAVLLCGGPAGIPPPPYTPPGVQQA